MSWHRHIGRRLKLRDLYILMTVTQTRGMAKAAAQLNISQPAVSNAIADLERALGHRLLDRSRSGVEPTAYGHALVTRAVAAFDELQQGVKDIDFLADPTRGDLHIGIPAHAAGFAAAVIGRLARTHPRLSFRVTIADTAASCRALEQRQVDLAILHLIRPISADVAPVAVLCDDPHVVAAGVDNPWTRRRKVRLADLMQETWAMPAPESPLGSMVEEAFRAEGLPVPATAVVAPLPVRYPLLAAGRFLTMMPRVGVVFPMTRPALKKLPVELASTRRPFAILSLVKRTISPVAQLFVNVAREIAKPLA